MRAKRSLGQHFLVSAPIVGRILAACREECGGAAGVLEIGPGRGALTEGLASLGKPFWAVELDYELADDLGRRFPSLSVILDDASRLDVPDFARKAGLGSWLVVGNLPYNVGTRILQNVLASPGLVRSAVVMLQTEVAWKFCAGAGQAGYGPLAVWVTPWWERRALFSVPPGAFRPQPKVASTVCLFRSRERPELDEGTAADYAAFATRMFSHPRKTLAGGAPTEGLERQEWRELLACQGIEPSARPGQVQAEAFARLFKVLHRASAR